MSEATANKRRRQDAHEASELTRDIEIINECVGSRQIYALLAPELTDEDKAINALSANEMREFLCTNFPESKSYFDGLRKYASLDGPKNAVTLRSWFRLRSSTRP